jgi:serine/threonine protein kinase
LKSKLLKASKDMILKGMSPKGKTMKFPPDYLPTEYADVVPKKQVEDPSYGDYENSCVKFNFQDDFEFQGKLGRGRYSEVFKAVNILDNSDVVVKMLKPGK